MDIQHLSRTFGVKRLAEQDAELVYEISCGNELFYRHHPPFATTESILADMQALPPGKSHEDKYYCGFFDDGTLIAVMDLILAYPDDRTVFIGFFMVHPAYQGKGIGSSVFREVASCLKELGYVKVRLGVDKNNPQSLAFWKKNRFTVTSENQYLIMELNL